jgi:hypothetical protein
MYHMDFEFFGYKMHKQKEGPGQGGIRGARREKPSLRPMGITPLSVWCDEMADGSRLVLLYPYE